MTSMMVQTLAVITMCVALLGQQAAAETHYLEWSIQNSTITRDCHTVTVATVNGMFPGPTVTITEGDTLVVTVTNNQIYPVTMHWHGIRQFGTNYADGPAYITQCPIQQGGSYVYEFTVTGQSGTFFYHAHINWLRATVHGALIVRPKLTPPYGPVKAEIPIILGEWFGMNANEYELGFLYTPAPAENVTTVTPTINGFPGPLYNCSNGDITSYSVEPKQTYLLRIINAAMNSDYHFRVASHKLTVVAADGNYLKPFRTEVVAITPGQTTDVLLITSRTRGNYYFGFSVGLVPNVGAPPPSIPALGVFKYTNANQSAPPSLPVFPNNVTRKYLDNYVKKLKNYNGTYDIPTEVTQDLIYTVNTAFVFCNADEPCATKIMGAVQNITFDDPTTTSILEAYANGVNGVYTADFPDRPPTLNISIANGPDPNYFYGSRGTRVKMLQYGDVVQVVLQNVFAAGILDHPFHLHGHDFYVVGRGYGIYNPAKDPAKFNLVDPPLYNTFGLPTGGWVALRFHANNPGVWLMHCHFERHKTWGMMMAFITSDGGGNSLQAPLHPLPSCSASSSITP